MMQRTQEGRPAVLVPHGVLTDTTFTYIKPGDRKPRSFTLVNPLTTAAEMYLLAEQIGVNHLWIMPGTELDTLGYDLYHFDTACSRFSAFYPAQEGKPVHELPKFCTLEKVGCKMQLFIGYPHRDNWGWIVNTPAELLGAIFHTEHRLQVPVVWTPANIALKCLTRYWKKHKEWLAESIINLFDLPFMRSAYDPMYKRSLTLESIGNWIHCYDKNSAYFSAMRGLTTGCGTPTHYQGETETCRPGIYRVSVLSSPEDDLIAPIASEWVTLDALQYALKFGYQLAVHESWQFEESHKLFTGLAVNLYETRNELKKRKGESLSLEHAYYLVSQVIHSMVGKFGDNKYVHKYMRPNWYADIVGKSFINMLLNLRKFAALGRVPFIVNNDGLYFECEDCNPVTAVPGILDKSDELGGYKHVFSIQITEEIVTASQVHKDKFISYLKKAAGVN